MAPSGGGGRTLNRDFKDVRRHTHVAVGQTFNGWIGLGVGFALGLAVAFGVHLYDRRQVASTAEPVPAAEKVPASAAAPDDAITEASTASPDAPDLDFYDVLPKQEVDVTTTPTKASGGAAARTPLPTGDAVLQAGSFKQTSEAEKMVAQLALYGIDSKIQRASVDDETWYRVRIGPIATVEELRNVQSKLREAEIPATPVTSIEEAPLP